MKVSKEQFDRVLNAYGRDKLTGDTTGICEPPITSYHDFNGGKMWPKGRIAWIVRNSSMPQDWNAGPDEYYVEDNCIHLITR